MPHPDIAWIVSQADTDLVALGKDLGLREAIAFLDELAGPYQDGFADGIVGARDAVEWARELSDDYVAKLEDVNPNKLDFDPTDLLTVLDAVVEQCKHLGWEAAIEAARDHRDSDAAPPPDDPHDEDEDHAYLVDFSNGSLHAAQQLVAHFGVDPDPDWEPAS